MRDHLFHLTATPGTSLQTQVREMMVRAILDGHIPPGSAVPSCRGLAQQLGVARNTVVLAYQRLVDEGYLVARERSGYYVDQDILSGRVPPIRAEAPPETPDVFGPRWDRRLQVQPSMQRNIEKPKDWLRYRYPFIYGQLDLALFPLAEWRECSREALTARAVRRWARDAIDSDDPDLLEQLRTRVLPRRGIWASPEQILVTVGAQHALYLVSELLLGPDSVVGLEEPGYTDARNIFSTRTRELRALRVDDQGLVPGEAVAECDYVFVTPSHQHPTTVTLSVERRRALLADAQRHDFVLIEDDYESETNYIGNATPALKSLDHDDRVIYVGSLSKTLAPGLRLGYMVAAPALIEEARALRRLMLRHPPTNNESTAALFLSRGHHDSLVKRLRHAYKERWEAMQHALSRHLPDSSRPPTFGGTAYWVQGPEDLDVRRLQALAQEEEVLIEPGDVFFQRDPPPLNCFRLGFSSIPTERIEPGIERLAALLPRARRRD